MAGLSGADSEQLETLARLIEGRARALDGLARMAGASIEGSTRLWDGPDAGSFRHAWQTVHAPRLIRSSADLLAVAELVRRNAAAQTMTSRAVKAGGNDGGGGGGWGLPLGPFGLPVLPDVPDLPDLPGPGDLWDTATDRADRVGDTIADGASWLSDQVSDGWEWASNEITETGDTFKAWGYDRLTGTALLAGDFAIHQLLSNTRALKLAAGTGLVGTTIGALFAGPFSGPIGGSIDRHLVAPRLRNWWNNDANPWLVERLSTTLEDRIDSDGIPTGDLTPAPRVRTDATATTGLLGGATPVIGIDPHSPPETEAASPTSSSTTTEPPTTETTLTPEQEQFLADIELAERFMAIIRPQKEARAACLADPQSCDLDALTEHTTGAFREITINVTQSRIERRAYTTVLSDETYFVKHNLVSEDPFQAEVWTCESYGGGGYELDEAGNRINVTEPNPRSEFRVYGVVEQPDRTLLIEQFTTLNDPDQPKPEGGTCDAYEDWPPPLPSS